MTSSPTVFTSKLYPDISDVIKKDPSYTSVFNFEVKLHTELLDLDYRDGILLENLSITRDYINNIGDYIEIQLSIPPGTFIHDVYDYLDNIEITIITKKQNKDGNKPVEDIERYKAIYLLDKNSKIPNLASYKKDDLNNQLPFSIVFQLLDRTVETFRIKTVFGNFDKLINENKDNRIDTFLKSVISDQVNKVLIENKPIVHGFNIEPIDNEDELKSLNIPSYTRVIELPKLIQKDNIGVYLGDIGIYVQKFGKNTKDYKKYIFIYSLYNHKKYDDAEHKVIIYSPLNNSLSGHDASYKYEDSILKIVSLTVDKLNDLKESSFMSYGSGFRSSNAHSYMKKPVEITEKGPKFKRERLDTEIILKERKDGLQFSPNKGTVTNQFSVISEILKRAGSYIELEVLNLDPDFVKPGDKCKVTYEEKSGDIKEIYGIIHFMYVNYSKEVTNKPLDYSTKTSNFTSSIFMKIFIGDPDVWHY